MFRIWNEQVSERKSAAVVAKLMEHFNLPIFVNIGRSEEVVNAFFQAKYGFFTCFDSAYSIGRVNFDIELITYWER